MEKELDSKIFMINDYSDKNNMEEHIKEYIKKGNYYTIDYKVLIQHIGKEDYFDNFGLEIRIHTDEDSLDNTIQIKHNGILIKEFNIDKNNLDIASLQEEYHEEKLSEVKNAIIEKYNIIKTKTIKIGIDKDTGLPFTYYTDGPTE